MSDRSRLRLIVMQVLVMSLLVTLLGRLWFLQIHDGAKYQNLAAENTHQPVVTEATRGLILDDMGRLLVTNRTTLAVTVDPSVLRTMTAAERTASVHPARADAQDHRGQPRRRHHRVRHAGRRRRTSAGPARRSSRSRSPRTSASSSRCRSSSGPRTTRASPPAGDRACVPGAVRGERRARARLRRPGHAERARREQGRHEPAAAQRPGRPDRAGGAVRLRAARRRRDQAAVRRPRRQRHRRRQRDAAAGRRQPGHQHRRAGAGRARAAARRRRAARPRADRPQRPATTRPTRRPASSWTSRNGHVDRDGEPARRTTRPSGSAGSPPRSSRR